MKTILIIESDKQLLEEYKRKLRREWTVFGVSRAQQAVDILDGGSVEIDLIIMDINLDSNNGIELIHEIRAYDDWVDIPIVLLSTIPRSALANQHLERYGVSAYLYKPHTLPRDLLREVKRIFAKVAV